MKVNITEEEYNAINEVVNQASTDYECASEENYLISMDKAINLVRNVLLKYRKSREQSEEFKQIRASVAERYRGKGLRSRDIDSLARQVLKAIKNISNYDSKKEK